MRGLFQALFLAVMMFTSLGGYLLVLKWRGDAAVTSTWTPLDDWLPFWPSWIWVYGLPYLVGPIFAGLLSRSTFWWYVRRAWLIVIVTLVIFVVFPAILFIPPYFPFWWIIVVLPYFFYLPRTIVFVLLAELHSLIYRF